MKRKKGRRNWPQLHHVQDLFKSRMDDPRLPDYARAWFADVYYRLLWHENEVEYVIDVLLEEKARNPAFPDDLGDWLRDNYDDEDEDDEEEEEEEEEDDS